MKKRQKIKVLLLAVAFLFGCAFTGGVSVKAQDEVKTEIKDSGMDGKISWSIDANGHLLITGDGDYADYAPAWIQSEFVSEIKTATVKVSNMTRTQNMFNGCINLTSVDLTGFDTSKVTDMSFVFCGCRKLTSIDLTGFNTEHVTTMQGMFLQCESLTNLNLSNFDTAEVKNMNNMFYNCYKLISLNLSNFKTENVTDMSFMFYECNNLQSLNLNSFKAGNITNMKYMFYNCGSLKSLQMENFDARNITSVQGMFSYCKQLEKLDLSGWDLSKIYNADSMLYGMNNLIMISLPNLPIDIELPGIFYDEEHVRTEIAGKDRGKIVYILPAYADSYCGKNGHSYDKPMFIWNADYKKVKVRFKCLREDCYYDNNIEIPAVLTSETIEPTIEKEGKIIYTATVVLAGNTYTDVKSVVIEKLPQPQEPAKPQEPAQPQTPTAKLVGTSVKTTTTFFRVTKAGKTPELAYMGPKNKKVKKVTIPATVKIDGVTYKVTSVAAGALKNYKNLTTVTIGKNVTKIGKNAFYGCKKLGKIVIKTKKLKSIGKNAFKGIKKNATIDVPNSKKKAYKKLLKAKTGYKKTMKIK